MINTDNNMLFITDYSAFFLGIIVSLLLFLLVWLLFRISSDAKQQRKRITQSEQSLKIILQYLPTAIILLNKEQRIKEVNKAAAKLFELDQNMVKDQILDTSKLLSHYKIVEKKVISANGTRYVIHDPNKQVRIIYNERIPFYLQSEKYVIEFFHEQTTILKKQASGLSPQQTEFIANISHELRTPLNGIIGMTDLLLSSSKLSENQKEMTSVAKRSAETLLSLINDILDFSKLESGKFEIESITFNLNEEIKLAIQDALPFAREKKISVYTDFNHLLPQDFLGDPIRIRQVLSNLLNNAIKFTPHGKITVSAEPGKTVNGGPALLFSIKDTGIGITNEKIRTIFEPFAQADQSISRQYGGTGLGTTICKQLVQLMGGEIWAKSPSGVSTDPKYPGTKICFTIPLKTNRHNKDINVENIFSFAQINTYVITDDPLQVQVLTRNLIALRLNFKIALPTQDTIKTLKQHENLHLLIIDHRFDLNGLDFLHELHNHRLHEKSLILIQSSDFHTSNTGMARRLGADVYLRKPIPLFTLKNFLISNFVNLSENEKNQPLSIPEEFNILLIEKNSLNQRLVENLLRRLGYETLVAESAERSIKVFKEKSIHMVLIDTFLPMQDTFELISEFKQGNNKCPIVLTTTEQELNQELQEKYEQAGVTDYLLKPIKFDGIYQIILKWGLTNQPTN